MNCQTLFYILIILYAKLFILKSHQIVVYLHKFKMMIGKPLTHKNSLKFIFGGNSTVTFLNTETNNRFTYRVRKRDKIFFASVLTSPDHYTFIGSIFNDNFKHSKKSTISFDAQSIKVFGYVLKHLQDENLPEFIEIWHEGKCGKCNRQLTVPGSIEIGFGPECIKNIFSKEEIRNFKLIKLTK
jgi:hypothetical protein